MKVAIIAASLLAAAQSVFAHTYLDHIVLPGGANGDCVRHTSQWTTGQRNYPIKDLTSENMICGFAPTQPAAQRCPITAGSKLGLIFGHDRPGDDIIAASHWGACNIYLAAQPANGGVPTGADWFKIQEEGYPNGKWCTSRLIETKGLLDVTLPSNLPSGKYLLRAEIGALHEADTLFTQNPARGLQLYVYCAELTVTGSGNANFSPKVDFPGAITYQSPGVLFNVYAPFNSYPTFGPAIAKASGSAPAPPTKPTAVPVPPPKPTAKPPTQPTAVPVPPTKPTPVPVPKPTAAPAPAPGGTPRCQDVQPKCWAQQQQLWADFNACVSKEGMSARCKSIMDKANAKGPECNSLKCNW